jgi:hypothetical protein
MRRLILIMFALVAYAQNYASYNGNIVARMSFLRSQYFDTTGGGKYSTFRDPSMIAYWPFNIPTVDSAYDFSGHNTAGTYFIAPAGSSWYFGPGKLARYTSYWNDAGDYVQIPSISIPVPFTVSAWVWPKQTPSANTRILETAYATGVFLGTTAAGTGWQFIVNSSTVATCTGGSLTVGAWQMVSATYDGANGYIYVNGSQVAGPCAFTSPGIITNSMRLGCYNTGTNCTATAGALKGEIADIRIYSRVLPQAEIQTIYNAENH